MEDWIKLPASITESWLWAEKPYGKVQAWLTLLYAAREECVIVKRGIVVTQARGSVCMSVREMSDEFGWSDKKTKRFLDTLESDGKIKTHNSNVINVIEIKNYDEYNVPKNGTTQQNLGQTTQQMVAVTKSVSESYKEDVKADDPTEFEGNDPTELKKGAKNDTTTQQNLGQTTQQMVAVTKSVSESYKEDVKADDPTEFEGNDPTEFEEVYNEKKSNKKRETTKDINTPEININSQDININPEDNYNNNPSVKENINGGESEKFLGGESEKTAPQPASSQSLERRKFNFIMSVNQFCQDNGGKYTREMIVEFIDYWTEANRSKTKMRFEKQETWEVSKRLAYWKRRSDERKRPTSGSTSRPQSVDDAVREALRLNKENSEEFDFK